MPIKATFASLAALIAAGALGYSLIGTSQAVEDGISSADTERVEKIVKNYLMENPEVIIDALREYENKMERQAEAKAKQGVTEYMPAILAGEAGHVGGAKPEDAKVVVMELFDYHCGFCKKATGLVADLTDEKDVAIAFLELPILREESDLSAKMALAAREQGKYEDLHFAMMNSGGILTEARIKELAKRAGLNTKQLQKDFDAGAYETTLAKSQQIAQKMDIQGTPAFIVASADGSYTEIIRGWDPAEIKKAIKVARKAK